MVRTGILTEDDAVELLEGWLVHKTTKNPPHTATTRYTRAALEKYLRPGYFVDSQEPITLSDSEPEPDVFIMGSRFTGLPTWSTHRLKSIPSHLDQCVHPITVASLCIV